MTEIALYDARTIGDMDFASDISRILAREYPGHRFYVHVDSSPSVGMVIIQHWMLSEKDGYYLKLSDLANHDDIKKKCIAAGGEILERFSVRRGKADQDELRMLERQSAFR